MSFGGVGQGNVRYAIILDDADAIKRLNEFKIGLTGIVQPSTALTQNLATLNQNFIGMGTGITKSNTLFATNTTELTKNNSVLTTIGTGVKTLTTNITGLNSPTQTVNTNMGALSNNFKILDAVEKTAVIDTNALKTGISAISTPTQTVSNNIKTLGGNLSPLAGNFRNTSGAAGDMIVQTKNLSSESKSLGSRIKDNAGRFSTFAIGLGTVISSSINLVRSFRDVQDSHITVEKSARKLSIANEAVDKATQKLTDDTKKYGANSKEVKQDTLDLTQAHQAQKIAVEVNAQKTKAYNDSLVDLGTSTIPTILGTFGTLLSAFNDAGIKGGILNKGVVKIKDTFKGLGSSALGLGGGIKGVATNLGLLAFATVGAIGLLEQINKTMKIFNDVSTGAITPVQGLKKQLDEMQKLDFSSIEQAIITIAKLTGGSAALASIIEKLGAGDLKTLPTSFNKINDAVKPIPTSFNGAATSANAMVNRLIVLETKFKAGQISSTEYAKGIFEVQQKLGTQGFGKAQDEANKLLGTYTQTVKQAVPPTQQYGASSGEVDDALKKLGPSIIDVNKNTTDLNSALVAGARAMGLLPPLVDKNAGVIQGFGKNIDDLRSKFLALNTAQPKIMGAFHLSPDIAKYDQLLKGWGGGVLNKVTTEQAKLNAAAKQGTTDFKSFVEQTQLAAVKNKVYSDSLRATLVPLTEIPSNIHLTTSELEDLTKAFIDSKAGLIPESQALQKVSDIVQKQLAPAFAKFSSVISTMSGKDFSEAFKKIDFGNISKGLKNAFKDIDKSFQEVAKRSTQVGNLFSQVAIAGGKLSDKNIGKAIKEIANGFGDMAKKQPLVKQFGDAVIKFLTEAPNKAEAFKKLSPVMDDFNIKMENGKLDLDEFNPLMAKLGETTGTTIAPVNKSAAAIKAFGVSSASARGQIDAVTGSFDVLNTQATITVGKVGVALKTISSIQVSPPNESAYQKGLQLAIANAAQTVKFIDKALQKVKGIVIPPPNESKYQKGLQLAINNAAQTVKKIDSELKKVSSIKVPAPDLHNFNSALNQMVSNAKRAARETANALKSARSSGGSQGHGPGATTGPFRAHGGIDIVNKPTTVTFGEAGPEAAVFIPLNGRTSSSSGRSDNSSSGMSGDLNVTNIIRLDDREILRSFRRKMGTNRFTMGP